jgi:threonyl-tRNA synthetase
MGDSETWDAAEGALREALGTFLELKHAHQVPAWYKGTPYSPTALASCLPEAFQVDEGGGAFYGPKIDVAVEDALGREHQCGTVQLDFQLPQRFGLKYAGAGGEQLTPVIIHRALLGSVERMLAILTEHTGGRWPFWLSPRQVAVLPVAERHVEAAGILEGRLHAQGLHSIVDASARSIPKKVRAAQVAQCNVMVVMGDEEAAAGSATLRWRDDATAATARVALLQLAQHAPWPHAVAPSLAHDSADAAHLSVAHPFTCSAAGVPELLSAMAAL